MCGICGIVYSDRDQAVSEPILSHMCQMLHHRGPDEDGHFIRGHAGLAMRRLSIIDLSTGSQPIFNETGEIGVVYNGEIYNFAPIRDRLIRAGHTFKTETDTEVIVHGYEEYGPDIVAQLNGMFTLALWDDREHRLLLARDRAGQKPLFYAHTPDRLLFASEIKALLCDMPRELNHRAIFHYLSMQYVPGPETIIDGVMQLPPGHIAVWQDGTLDVRPYWQPTYEPKQQQSTADWVRQTREAITAAVERHLMSDVPLGAFLSGGVDSSIIVGIMSQLTPGNVKTFSIGFDVDAYSETEHARRIADRFGTTHHEFIVSAQQVTDALADVVYFADQPLADTSCLATFQLARMTRDHVTVALTGDGGDEAFAGYTRYTLDRLLRAYRVLPEVVRTQTVPALAGLLPERADIPTDRNIVTGLKRLAQASTTTHKASILAWGSFFSAEQKAWLAQPEWYEKVAAKDTHLLLASAYDMADAQTHLDKTLSVDFVTYLADDLLVKADRMAMGNSLETRAPFLDNEVIALAAQMPERLKIRGTTQKWVLREAFADLLPRENVQRIKRGFGMPVASWLRGHMQSYAHDVLLDPRSLERGIFQPDRVRTLLDAHTRGESDHGQRLWALLVLELWQRRYIDEAPC